MTKDLTQSTLSRRTLLKGAAISGALHALAFDAYRMEAETMEEPVGAQAAEPGNLKICIFSKHLQWASVTEAAAVAKEIGFDGVDLTVRSEGHVLPENVETDLPKAVETIRRAGLEVPMISTEITSVDSPHAEAILKTAHGLGIRQYRWNGLMYKADQGIAERLKELQPQVNALAALNEKYAICGMYHTHSGPGMVGGPVWDLWIMFRQLNPQWIGVNYDIGHATVEGGYGGWIASSRLVKNYMRGIALKDFRWAQNEGKNTHPDPYDKSLGVANAWVPHWCPIGEGMVNFPGFFKIVKDDQFSGPVQLHFEYPLGGAENGKRTLTMPKQEVIAAMHRDLTQVKAKMHAEGLL
jgi:L-ribulose-5-phosphate 3-epimerase